MTVSINDIEAFHRFAIGRVSENSENQLTFDELFIEWDSQKNREEINAAIRRGIADVDAGRTRPVEDFNKELREKFELPK